MHETVTETVHETTVLQIWRWPSDEDPYGRWLDYMDRAGNIATDETFEVQAAELAVIGKAVRIIHRRDTAQRTEETQRQWSAHPRPQHTPVLHGTVTGRIPAKREG